MKKPIRRFITYLWTLPWDILTWLSVLLIWLCWGTKLHWLEGLWCELKPNSWPTMTWYRVKDATGNHVMNPIELQPTLGMWIT